MYLKNREALENLKGGLSPHLTALEIRKVFYAFCGGRENFSNRKDYSRTEPLGNGIHLFSCEHLETNSLAVRILIKKEESFHHYEICTGFQSINIYKKAEGFSFEILTDSQILSDKDLVEAIQGLNKTSSRALSLENLTDKKGDVSQPEDFS